MFWKFTYKKILGTEHGDHIRGVIDLNSFRENISTQCIQVHSDSPRGKCDICSYLNVCSKARGVLIYGENGCETKRNISIVFYHEENVSTKTHCLEFL